MWRAYWLEKTLMLGRIKTGAEGEDRGWDGWVALPAQWTWDCASSGRWWETGRPGMLQSMGSQRASHDWATAKPQQSPYVNPLLQTECILPKCICWKPNIQGRQHIKKQRHYFANKGPSSQSYGFSSRHVWMWELDYKERWALKKLLLNCSIEKTL